MRRAYTRKPHSAFEQRCAKSQKESVLPAGQLEDGLSGSRAPSQCELGQARIGSPAKRDAGVYQSFGHASGAVAAITIGSAPSEAWQPATCSSLVDRRDGVPPGAPNKECSKWCCALTPVAAKPGSATSTMTLSMPAARSRSLRARLKRQRHALLSWYWWNCAGAALVDFLFSLVAFVLRPCSFCFSLHPLQNLRCYL